MTIYWINFRGDLAGPPGFAGDGANSTGNFGAVHPTSMAGGFNQGWVTTYAGTANNDNSYPSFEHQGGFATSTAGLDNSTFRISGITPTHTYNVYMSLGAIFAPTSIGYTLYSDNRSTTLHNEAGSSVAAGSLLDATGALFTSATLWAAGQAPISVTATTSDFYFCKSSSGNNAWFNAIGIEDITPTTRGGTLTLMGV